MKKPLLVGIGVALGAILVFVAIPSRNQARTFTEVLITTRTGERYQRHVTDPAIATQLGAELSRNYPNARGTLDGVAILHLRASSGYHYVRVPYRGKPAKYGLKPVPGASGYPTLDKILNEDGWTTIEQPDLRESPKLAWTSGQPNSNADIFTDGTFLPTPWEPFKRRIGL